MKGGEGDGGRVIWRGDERREGREGMIEELTKFQRERVASHAQTK